MTIWRYVAVPLRATDAGPEARGKRVGELAAESRREVRASLRRIGLQVVDLRAVRSRRAAGGERRVEASTGWWRDARRAMREWVEGWLRGRRREQRAEFHDGLATMLASGVPLLETVETLISSTKRHRSPLRWMLVQVREDLRGGSSLGEAMAAHPTWFEPGETAMVRAGQHSGTLPDVLRSLAERHERSGELGQKLAGALAYPTIVALVGVVVFLFLSTRTLPDLVKVLVDAGIDPPALTMNVIALGQVVASWGVLVLVIVAAIAVAAAVLAAVALQRGVEPPRWLRAMSPRVLRRMAVARLSFQLSEMLRTGVPVVEALRVLAPTARRLLRRRLLVAADRVERGDELSAALDDEHWFSAEFRRLLEIGQASGELDALLERLGHRYSRQARRLIDRLTALLEPVVILTLAVLVGIVVMAAVLPLLRLQEII